MKKILLSSLMAAAAAVPAFAGVDNINYQAVIKNGNEIVANRQVDMKFELLDNETVVYSEQQSMTTNASGLVSCQLGGEELSTIEWGDLTLRVSINFGNGYEVISNETVSSVPTALYALRSADGDNLRAEIDDFANMVEFRFDKVEKGLGDTDNSIAQLTEQTEAFATMVEGRFDLVEKGLGDTDKSIEQLTEMTDAFATMNEQRIDRLQSQVDRIDNALEVSGTTDYSALIDDLKELKKQTEEGLAKVDVFADAFDEIEAIVAANEETQATLRNMSADIAQVEGIAKEIEELNTNTESFAEMTEARFDKVEKELGDTQKEIAELNTNTESFATMVEERFDKVENELGNTQKEIAEINTNTESFATMVEERFDKVEKELSNTDQNIEEIGGLVKDVEEIQSNVKNLSADVAQIEGLATKVETLENSFNILTKGEDGEEGTLVQMGNAIGELGEEVEKLVKDNEETQSTLRSMSADVAQVEGIATKVESLENSFNILTKGEDGEEGTLVQMGNAIGEIGNKVDELNTNTESFATMAEARIDKLEKELGEAQNTIEELQDMVNQLMEALRDMEVIPTPFK